MTRDQTLPRLIGGLLLALVMLTSAPAAYAQTTDTESRAITIGPLSVVKTEDLLYGDIISGPTNGTVNIDTRNGAVTATGGATPVGGTTSRASFIVYGGPWQLIDVSIPGSLIVTHSNGTDQMLINDLSIGNGGRDFNTFVRGWLRALGIYTLTVGGRLNVTGDQEPGQYTGSFIMTVDYL